MLSLSGSLILCCCAAAAFAAGDPLRDHGCHCAPVHLTLDHVQGEERSGCKQQQQQQLVLQHSVGVNVAVLKARSTELFWCCCYSGGGAQQRALALAILFKCNPLQMQPIFLK
jgi:hypothetical protein